MGESGEDPALVLILLQVQPMTPDNSVTSLDLSLLLCRVRGLLSSRRCLMVLSLKSTVMSPDWGDSVG